MCVDLADHALRHVTIPTKVMMTLEGAPSKANLLPVLIPLLLHHLHSLLLSSPLLLLNLLSLLNLHRS